MNLIRFTKVHTIIMFLCCAIFCFIEPECFYCTNECLILSCFCIISISLNIINKISLYIQKCWWRLCTNYHDLRQAACRSLKKRVENALKWMVARWTTVVIMFLIYVWINGTGGQMRAFFGQNVMILIRHTILPTEHKSDELFGL